MRPAFGTRGSPRVPFPGRKTMAAWTHGIRVERLQGGTWGVFRGSVLEATAPTRAKARQVARELIQVIETTYVERCRRK